MSDTRQHTSESPLGPALVLLMAVTTGLAVASNYYAQPLLHTIADRLALSYSSAGIIVTTAQGGYAAGLLLLVPLGDLFERRRMIVIMMLLAALGLLISASAGSLAMLLLGTAITGVFSVVAQVLVPFAATLAEPERRGRVVGTVMSGLLLGILLARTVAGALSSLGDWRTIYWVAAILMLLNALILWRMLPRYRQSAGLSYGRLLMSIATLFRRHPLYRLRASLGFCTFATFSVLWTSLAFLLSGAPWHFSDATIGLFGLAGAAGALMARRAGSLADQGHAALVTTAGLGVLVVAWALFGLAGWSLVMLVAGIVLLDLALQAVHITNLNLIYGLDSSARNRLNAGYMTTYFLGGAFGSLASAAIYGRFGWSGVVWLGFGLSLLAALIWSYGHRRMVD
ncbi:putative MFS family arabinose efflux permease [Kushneria sinocarnis]|uniref:Putative MFS family arabinose efflux permease n=1 Tax=Kushneria sinocarnis TaxID=595502 RepID=A0A420X1Z6_9GAMM|nr:MFS transporter [Kushneria sinocarnis]RKR07685.1 putative MFS family arabinose efflux permease [Kushneria sinocarnis]